MRWEVKVIYKRHKYRLSGEYDLDKFLTIQNFYDWNDEQHIKFSEFVRQLREVNGLES